MMLYYTMPAQLMVLSAIAAAISIPFDSRLDEHWDRFKKTYNKQYGRREEFARRLIWERKVAQVIHHNLRADMGLHTYTKGINEYSDLSPSNFVMKLNGLSKRIGSKISNGSTWLEPSNIEIPDKIDWRDHGLVTPVKNQKHCGSCWAFSATGTFEGQIKKKTGQLVTLSEQNLIDCTQSYGNYGCDGGLVENVYKYVEENGIDTENFYPTFGMDGDTCLFTEVDIGAICTGYVNIPKGDEDALMKAVATVGPISVSIDASNENFHLYSGGIYDEPNCSNEDLCHAVLVVGYGTEDGTDYWIVKNSWSISWGERGYAKMLRNEGNQCGIATDASYPLV